MAVIPAPAANEKTPSPQQKPPLLDQGWIRVLLFGVCFMIITALTAIPATLFLTDIKMDELMADPLHLITNLLTGDYFWLVVLLELVISVLSVVLLRLWVDRKSLLSLGLGLAGRKSEAAAGFFIGVALLGLGSLLLCVSGHFKWSDIDMGFLPLLKSLALLLVIAFSEELVFRGYILNNLLESFNKWTALAVSAGLFALFHITNPGIGPLAFANLILAGMLLGLNYLFTRNLWFSIFLHFGWNFFQGPLLGFRVSGIALPSLLKGEAKGDALVTGGNFGLEGSILITAITIISLLLLTLVFEKKYSPSVSNGNQPPPPAQS